MSDQGEKTCPLCAEEMDLTDQQLKPCKCGYEICVWCWHHIMDMAEKDNVEGRCPACRTPYNKEKIVDKSAQCERLVSELSVEKKVKSKSKSKTPDGRKNLSSVRVIQRNLVYIAGLPLNLADEDLLQREEYFPRYGKVQKVSISRTAAGTIQQFPNNTCSVYITYSKEEEAVRCIQSVHGYILEGRPLRACFGTTKYCHAWMRNMPCSNPDCLYLHEFGTQEDSFIKDEIISSCTRNRVEQITGATVDMQRRSGNVLPWPADESCNNNSSSSGVSNSKSSTNNVDICSDSILESSVWQTPASSVRGSPPNSSCSKSVVLPAASSWGMRASNRQPSPTSATSSNGPSKQKSDACGISVAYSTAIASPAKVSVLHSDSGKKLNGEIWFTAQRNKSEPVASVELYLDGDQKRKPSNTSAMTGYSINQVISSQISTPPLKVDGSMSMPADVVKSVDSRGQYCVINPERDPHVPVESKVPELCSDILALNIDNQELKQRDTEYREFAQSHIPTTTSKDPIAPRDQSECRLESQFHVAETDTCEVKNDILSYDIQSFRNPEAVSCSDKRPILSQLLDSSRALYPQEAYNSPNVNVDSQPNKFFAQEYNIPVMSDGCCENQTRSFNDLNSTDKNSSYVVPNESRMMRVGRCGSELVKHDSISDNDMGESSIISNILSMNFDSWDDSLASPQNLAKLLGETDKHQVSLGVSSTRKTQNSNQSRFSFAREEDQTGNYGPSFTGFDQTPRIHSFTNKDNNGSYNVSEITNGFSTFGAQQPGNSASIHSHNSLNRFSVSRAPVSAPPGFSGPNRAPPPGFTTYDRMEQTLIDINSGNNLLDNSSFMRNTNQSLSTMHFDTTNADIEFMDPAILAVGKGRFPGGLSGPGLDTRSSYTRSSYPTQMSNYENESRFQPMMQRSLSSQQNSRYLDMGDSFSSRLDNYGMSPRISEQALANNGSQYSQFGLPQSRNQLSGNWDGWSEVKGGNDSSMAEFLRSERFGINKYFTGYEDSKYRMPNSGDIYNQQYGI